MKPAPGEARAEGGTDTTIANEEYSDLLSLLRNGPQTPWQRHVHTYAKLTVSLLRNAETVYNETEREIRDAARFVEAGRIRLKNPESFLTAAHKALSGNADAFEYVARFIRRTSGMRSGIHTERLRERSAEPTVTIDA